MIRATIFVLLAGALFTGCQSSPSAEENNKALVAVAENYYNERIRLFPLEATYNGDNRYNDLLPVDFTDSYLDTLDLFFARILGELDQVDPRVLTEENRITYDILKREMEMSREGVKLKYVFGGDARLPFNQFWGLPLTFVQMGSGDNIQPAIGRPVQPFGFS